MSWNDENDTRLTSTLTKQNKQEGEKRIKLENLKISLSVENTFQLVWCELKPLSLHHSYIEMYWEFLKPQYQKDIVLICQWVGPLYFQGRLDMRLNQHLVPYLELNRSSSFVVHKTLLNLLHVQHGLYQTLTFSSRSFSDIFHKVSKVSLGYLPKHKKIILVYCVLMSWVYAQL